MKKQSNQNITLADAKTDLRRGIDHIGVTVNFLVHDGNGKILLQKRSKHCRDEHHKWDIGGGAVEFGEELETALLRELMEEYTVTPLKYEMTGIYTALREHQGNPTHWIAVNYKVLVNPEHIKIGEPHKVEELGWFGLSELPDNETAHSMFHLARRIALDHKLIE